MELSSANIAQQTAANLRPNRYTMVLAAYDPNSRQATVTSVLSGQTTQGTRVLNVSRLLQTMPDTLLPGTLVVVERMTGRNPVVTDVVDRPTDVPSPVIAGGFVSFGLQMTPSINFTPHAPVDAEVSWDTGHIGLAGQTYVIDSGHTSGRYITWGPPSNQLVGQSILPAATTGTYIVAINEGGIPLPALGGIPGQALYSGSVSSGSIASGGIATYNIAANAIVSGLILDGNVTTPKIANLAVTSGKIALLNITNPLIALDAVQTTNILDANVTTPKIATNAIVSGLILDGNVTTPKIALLAIVSGLIAPGQVNDSHFTGPLSLAKLVSGPTYRTKFFQTADDVGGTNPRWEQSIYLGLG